MVVLLPLALTINGVRVRMTLGRTMLLPQAGLLTLCLAIGAFALWQGHDPFVAMSLPLVLAAMFANPFGTALLTLLATLTMELAAVAAQVQQTVPLSAA